MIEDCLRSFNDPVDIETLGANLDISSKTLYRYLQYMLRSGVVVADSSYARLVGPRPFINSASNSVMCGIRTDALSTQVGGRLDGAKFSTPIAPLRSRRRGLAPRLWSGGAEQ